MTPPGQALDVVKNAVVQQAQDAKPKDPLAEFIERNKASIAAALPEHLRPERMARIALTAIRRNPALAQIAVTNPASIAGVVLTAAQLGVEVNTPTGEAYMLPFGGEAQFILGYKGIVKLALQSGQVKSVEAREVCRNDEFEYSYGLEPKLVHKPALGERGEVYAYYGVAHFTNGGYYFVVMGKGDIEAHRKRSRSANKGPWVTDYDTMARKTCIRVMAPYLPLSAEVARRIAADETVVRNIPVVEDGEVIYDAEVVDDDRPPEGVDAATGEIVTPPSDATPPAEPDSATPLTPGQRNSQRRDITKKVQHNVTDAQLLALIRYATGGEKDLLVDCETAVDFYRVMSAVEHYAAGHLLILEDGTVAVNKSGMGEQ